jgi:broad specificity phosphatase PhoE
MNVIFVRHGKPDYTIADERKLTYFEKNFCPLDRAEHPTVEAAAADTRLSGADLILSSPYTRALQTAEIINRKLRLPLFVEFDLHEWKVDVKGKFITVAEISKRYQEYKKADGHHPWWNKRPWENIELLKARVNSILSKYQHYAKLIVVCHGALIQSIIGKFDEVPLCGIVEHKYNKEIV